MLNRHLVAAESHRTLRNWMVEHKVGEVQPVPGEDIVQHNHILGLGHTRPAEEPKQAWVKKQH